MSSGSEKTDHVVFSLELLKTDLRELRLEISGFARLQLCDQISSFLGLKKNVMNRKLLLPFSDSVSALL